VALLTNSTNPGNRPTVLDVHKAAGTVGLQVIDLDASTAAQLEPAFVAASKGGAEALIVAPDALFLQQRSQLAGLAARFRLPAVYGLGEFVEAGGLMSYGLDLAENFRRTAVYVDKILKGAKPEELPVEQPTKLALLLNQKTAQALGIRFPAGVLTLADKVIE
jgi:putative tryptophan/tyrosine transport system substrate-binding protein